MELRLGACPTLEGTPARSGRVDTHGEAWLRAGAETGFVGPFSFAPAACSSEKTRKI